MMDDKNSVSDDVSVEEDDPYIFLKKGYNNKNKKLENKVTMLTVGIFAMGVMLVFSSLVNVYQALYLKPDPYLLTVTDNNVKYSGQISDKTGDTKDEWIPSQMIAFITRWRTVTPDNTLQKGYANKLYCMLPRGSQSRTKMDEYFRDDSRNPFKLNMSESKTVTVTSILKQTANTWIVTWSEESRRLTGESNGEPDTYRSTLLLARATPTKDCYEGNPLGLYVRQLDWTTVGRS